MCQVLNPMHLCLCGVQLGSDPPGHGETGSSQRQELSSSYWP